MPKKRRRTTREDPSYFNLTFDKTETQEAPPRYSQCEDEDEADKQQP